MMRRWMWTIKDLRPNLWMRSKLKVIVMFDYMYSCEYWIWTVSDAFVNYGSVFLAVEYLQ